MKGFIFTSFIILLGLLCTSLASLAPIIDDLSKIDESEIIKDSFIITLKEGVSVSNHLQSFLSDFDEKNDAVKVLYTYDLNEYNGYSVEITDQKLLDELRSNPDIDYVEYDKVCKIAGIQRNAPWNLARISQRKLPLGNVYRYDSSAGRNVDIYIVDTGVRVTHREFQGRASFGKSFTGEPGQGDLNGHGTHVAGIAAGKTFGVAKKANIIAVRVLRRDGYGSWSKLIAALSWVRQNQRRRKKATVVNMSISGSKSRSVNSAVKALINGGIHVVVAAGNNNNDACEESPASEASAITVGSVNTKDEMSSFSNYGKCVDILAPGDPVESAYKSSNSATAWMAGTSMASPHVAGLKAVLLSSKKYSIFDLDEKIKGMSSKNTVKKLKRNTPNRIIYADESNYLIDTDAVEKVSKHDLIVLQKQE